MFSVTLYSKSNHLTLGTLHFPDKVSETDRYASIEQVRSSLENAHDCTVGVRRLDTDEEMTHDYYGPNRIALTYSREYIVNLADKAGKGHIGNEGADAVIKYVNENGILENVEEELEGCVIAVIERIFK